MVNPREALPAGDPSDPMVPLYEMADIDEFAGTLRSPRMVRLASCRSGRTKFRNGDVLFAKITPCVQNGKSALVRGVPGDLAFGSSEFYVLRPHSDVLPEFLFYFVRQRLVIDAAVASFTGTSGRQRVPRIFWESLQIPVPPLPVQERIVEILQKADEIRRKRLSASEILDAILPSIFHYTFGDPTSNPCGYSKTPLGNVTTLVTSGYTPRGGARNYVADGPLLLRSQNVRMLELSLDDCAHLPASIFEEMSRVRVEPGDVLLNITGASIGRVAFAPEDIPPAVVNQHVCIIRPSPSKITGEYLAYLLATPWYQHIILNAPGSAQTGFNHARVRALDVILPPIPVQKAFVDQVRALRETRQRYMDATAIDEYSLRSLMARAFTGELTAEWEAANAEQIAAAQHLYEALPRLTVLALLAEAARRNRSPVLVTALMKYVFLLQMEANGRRRFYQFVPYHYGPFAKELYSDLEQLRSQGLITIDEDTEEEKTRIAVADVARAEEALGQLPEDLRADVAAILDQYGELGHNRLLKTVYDRYPTYARKSRLRKKTAKKKTTKKTPSRARRGK
ncbi:hypothetical protein JCM19992_21820 [Thermostilla marina]